MITDWLISEQLDCKYGSYILNQDLTFPFNFTMDMLEQYHKIK